MLPVDDLDITNETNDHFLTKLLGRPLVPHVSVSPTEFELFTVYLTNGIGAEFRGIILFNLTPYFRSC